MDGILGPRVHAKRLDSISNAVVGLMTASVQAIHAIGQAYAQIARISANSGVKQIDQLLSNSHIEMQSLLRLWVQFVVGTRRELLLAMAWTEMENDKQAVLAIYVITNHGRATPLIWKTHLKSELKNNRNRFEYELVEQLHECIDPNVRITVLANRGFGEQKFYDFLMMLGWDFFVCFRGNILVTDKNGQSMQAKQWAT